MTFGILLNLLYGYFGHGLYKYQFVSSLIHNIMREPLSDLEVEDDDDENYYPCMCFPEEKSKRENINRIFNGTRCLPKQDALKIKSHYDDRKFREWFDNLENESRHRFVEELKEYDIKSDVKNLENVCSILVQTAIKSLCIGKINFEIPGEIKFAVENTIDNKDIVYKRKFGPELLAEVGDECPICNCHRSLFLKGNNGQSAWAYNIVKIDDELIDDKVDNMIALCPACAVKYQFTTNREDLRKLKGYLVKRNFRIGGNLDRVTVEGLERVIGKIAKIKFNKEIKLQYQPNVVANKIKNINTPFYLMVKAYVGIYYLDLKEIFMQTECKTTFKFNRLCQQIKWMYEDLRDNGIYDQEDIFDKLVDWLVQLTNEKRRYCEIIMAFFVQDCEVFDAIT